MKEDGVEGTYAFAEGSVTEIWWGSGSWRACQHQPSSAEGWCFLLVLLSAHRRLLSGLMVLCNNNLICHIVHAFSIEQIENYFKLLSVGGGGRIWGVLLSPANWLSFLKIMYQPECLNTTEIFSVKSTLVSEDEMLWNETLNWIIGNAKFKNIQTDVLIIFRKT